MKNHDFNEKQYKNFYHIEVILHALLFVILGMVDVFLGLWKYLKRMKVKSSSYFLN